MILRKNNSNPLKIWPAIRSHVGRRMACPAGFESPFALVATEDRPAFYNLVIYKKCFFINDLPEPDFKYFSKSIAFDFSLNAMYP